MTRSDAVKLVSKLLKMPEEKVAQGIISAGRDDLYYFAFPIVDGDGISISGESIIVSKEGDVLYANSSVSRERHLNAFDNGVRTPLDSFV